MISKNMGFKIELPPHVGDHVKNFDRISLRNMLHHYNYSTSLSHFLNYHQLEDQNINENDHTTPNSLSEDISQNEEIRCKSNSSANNNKSFTIAAILGLNNDKISSDMVNSTSNLMSDRSVLSNCSRLQLPVRHGSSAVGVTGHYSVTHGCPSRQPVRGLKHISSTVGNKKTCKSKRVRTIFTPEQLERLEAEFERQQYMVGPERLYLAHTLQLTEAQVKVWFQNRRIKWRKHHLEITHQRLAVLKQQQLLLDDSHPEAQDTNSSSTDT